MWFAHAPSCALVETAKSFHVICLSGPSLAPNSRTRSPSARLTTVPRTPLDILPPVAGRVPVRAGLRLGSLSGRAPKSVHSFIPLGDVSDLQGPVGRGGGGNLKEYHWHLILIDLWPRTETKKTALLCLSRGCVCEHSQKSTLFCLGSLLPVTLPLHTDPHGHPFHVFPFL